MILSNVWKEIKLLSEWIQSDDGNPSGATRQILLTGAHGVGKTYCAIQLAKELTGNEKSGCTAHKDRGTWELVSCHPAYSYEDFVRGVSVHTSPQQDIIYKMKDRVFMDVIDRARKADTQWHVLILDDIGRADLSVVLGELLYALEYRGHRVTLRDGGEIIVPHNLVIIATYNSAIRYEKPLDYALLRRFQSITIPNVLCEDDGAEHDEQRLSDTLYGVKEVKDILDSCIQPHRVHDKNQYMPGRGYFSDDPYLSKLKMRYQVAPLLRQYVKDDILQGNAVAEKIKSLEDDSDTVLTVDYRRIAHADLKIEKIAAGDPAPAYGRLEEEERNIKKLANSTKENLRNSPREAFEQLYPFPEAKWISIMNVLDNILDNQLLSNAAIAKHILFNKDIVWTISTDKKVQGHLLAQSSERERYNSLYTRGSVYRIHSREYSLFKRLTENNETESTVRNMPPAKQPRGHYYMIAPTLYNIVTSYYRAYIAALEEYMAYATANRQVEIPEEELMKLKTFAQAEFQHFVRESQGKLYDRLLPLVANLKILWAKRDSVIEDAEGNPIRVAGVFKMGENLLDIMEQLDVRQAILYGPPGTSKTYSAKKMIAQALNQTGANIDLSDPNWADALETYKLPADASAPLEHDVYWDLVQFHPSYSYEDFVRGITVKTRDDKTVYHTVNMSLGRMAHIAGRCLEEAGGDLRKAKKFFLIIDEINRANMANVFGELIYALEYRGQAVRTPYEVDGTGDTLSIPKNLYLIGTMNTADKSIGGMDYAIRRRFLFFPALPDADVVRKNNGDHSLPEKLFRLISRLFDHRTHLAEDYDRGDVQLGHTYFLVENDRSRLKLKFQYQMLPILHEYYKDGIIKDAPYQPDGLVSELMRFIKEPGAHRKDEEIEQFFNQVGEGIDLDHEASPDESERLSSHSSPHA